MTIAQIAYIASGYHTLIAERTHEACVDAAKRLGVLEEAMREYEHLRKNANYRAKVLGGAYV